MVERPPGRQRHLFHWQPPFAVVGGGAGHDRGSDVGGRFARKLVFYTGTGESMLAKVNEFDDGEWYPEPSQSANAWRA